MSSISQASYVARLSKAEQLKEFLDSFPTYQAGDEVFSSASLTTLIATLHQLQTSYTQVQHQYLTTATARRFLFTQEPTSLVRRLPLITAYVRAKFGKESQIYHDVNLLVKKIRGESHGRSSASSSEATISRYEKSFGSQLQNFQDLITLLEGVSAEYVPANELISFVSLQNLYQLAFDKTQEVTQKFSAFKLVIVQRQEAYQLLKDRSNGIKDMIKSQYGISSSEYNMVKGLKF